MKTDLKLVGTDYSNLGSIFYVGWLVWAIPGNLLLAKFPLSKYLAINVSLSFCSVIQHQLITRFSSGVSS